MTPERWAKVKEVVYDALALEEAERRAFLDAACGGDRDLRREVDSLLSTHGQGQSFLETGHVPQHYIPTPVGNAKVARGSSPLRRICPDCGEEFDPGAVFCPDDGAVLVEDPESWVGSTLDGLYAIEALLGSGGMGAVYRARHIVLGDRVAIKIMRGEMGSHPEWVRRFRREGQAARRFKHPNAVTVHDLRTSTDGTTYMVLEFVDGRTLRDEMLAEGGPLSPARALELLRPVADVLDAAHAHGVIHRDLKPENIMVSRDGAGAGVVKVLDLGIAKVRELADNAVTNVTALTAPGQIIGTPHYMSPEQWGEVPSDGIPDIDGRTDVYSLGVIVYELVSGRRPFSAATLQEIRREHVAARPARLDAIAPGVSARFADEVERALAKDRSGRHSSTGELFTALEAALHGPSRATAPAGRPTEPVPRTVVERSEQVAVLPTVKAALNEKPRTAPRRRTPWVIGALLAVAAGVALAVAFPLVWRRESPPAPVSLAAPLVMRYAVELEAPVAGQPRLAAEQVVRPGQPFKFRFTPVEDGYLYIVAPGAGNVLETLLTASPMPESGVTSNRIQAGTAYEFPGTPDAWLGLRDDTPETVYTIIFSREPLASPRFLAERAGRRLSTSEQTELQSVGSESVSIAAGASGSEVRAPRSRVVVFEIPMRLASR